MPEVVERVAKLEERLDSVTVGLADVRAALRAVESNLRAEMKSMEANLREEMAAGFTEMRSDMRALESGLRAEMNSQFRWLIAGIGSAALAILVAIFSRN